MLSNIQRIRLYLTIVVCAVIIVGIWVNIDGRRKRADIAMMNQVRHLSYALEMFKHDFWRYPEAQRMALQRNVVLSEKGFSAGDHAYFRGAIESPRAITYHSDGETYSISFTLRQRWPSAGLAGKKCAVSQHFILSCER